MTETILRWYREGHLIETPDGQLVIPSANPGNCPVNCIALRDVIAWVKANRPDLLDAETK